MAVTSSASFFQRRKAQYTQYGPAWSGSLWLAALGVSVVNHFFNLSLDGKNVSSTSPTYAASVQRIFSLLVELCLMCSNTAVMFHIVYRSSRRKPELSNLGSYILPVATFLILTGINVALMAVPMMSPAALATMTPLNPSTPAYYHYSAYLLLIVYGSALSLVGLAIAAGTVISWSFAQSHEEPAEREALLGLTWDEQNRANRD
ncbi:hypothetical protein RhiJN_03959 [Ceratobasidium sp. AG-Ba]|nr:hypothetical protein RhiJN_03959 [Ceratobasidium sp. AG-Ba]QRW04849.1 hypothetical protein RhiLY_03848 [Ceratobasidium sp. AG-Ba]